MKITLLRSGVSWGEIHDKERVRGESGGGQEWRQLRTRILTTTEPDKYQQASQSGDHLEALRATEGVGGLEDENDDVLLKSFRNVGKTISHTKTFSSPLIQSHLFFLSLLKHFCSEQLKERTSLGGRTHCLH